MGLVEVAWAERQINAEAMVCLTADGNATS